MKSDAESADQKPVEEGKEKRPKKVVIPPKSPQPTKPKRSNFLIKKLKIKSKSTSGTASYSDIKDIASLPLPSTSSESSPIERQTPEGDDNFILNKSASETNLQDSWKSAENLTKDDTKASSKSAVTVESNQFYISSEPKSLPERTKSLEEMPAYGELILEQTPSTSNANQTSSKPKDHLYKILVIGDLATGKTSIIKRYVHRFFTQHYRATIGVDFALKVLNWDDNTIVRLQLWDIAGQERYGNMTRVYYKEAVGAFIVFDVTRRNTFESVAKWKSDLDSKVQLPDGSSIPCVLLANKCDQQKEGIVNNPHKMQEYCDEHGFTAWFETSARDNINIDDAARTLVEKIMASDYIQNYDSKRMQDQISLTKTTKPQREGERVCC